MASNILQQNRRLISDYFGSILTHKWKRITNEFILCIDPSTFPYVINIYSKVFNGNSQKVFLRYSYIFRHIFYVAKQGLDVAGYCVYYIKPIITSKGIKKDAVIYSIAVDEKYRNKGIAKKLLEVSLKEMEINGISTVFLYVNKNNISAYSLYIKFGFEIIEEINNICGLGEKCYKMELKFM